MERVEYGVVVKLLFDDLRPPVELLGVCLGPPATEISLGIELPPFIIETMGDLMPDHRTHATVIHGIIGLRVEEWRLHDAGRKGDLVCWRVIVRVNGGGCHPPFAAIG